MPPRPPSSGLPRLLNLVLPPLQPLAGALAPAFGIGMGNAEMTRLSETPVVPAGYAFGIWGPIFLAAIAYGIWQALPARRDDPLLARLRGPLALAFGLNIAWMLASQLLGNGWHLVAILAGIVAALVPALLALARAAPRGAAERWLLRPLVGVWAGWASAAAFANLSITARWAGFGWWGLGEQGAAVLVILAATAFGAAVLRAARGDPWYAGGVGWALVAIVAANLGGRYDAPGVAAVAALCLGAVVAVALVGRRGRATASARPAAAGAPG